MDINFHRIKHSGILGTILFYSTSGILIYVLDKISPSGPCTPSPGLFCFMLLPVISIILFFINIFQWFKKQKENSKSALIHLGFIVGFLIFINLNSN